ncbi:hypothetical protein SNOG_01245 [Parastagonospora nodorum SN15]|uniref:Mif2/CENP-C cupin domain-containing protein n=1 Tax=Phaeosphaeria nodorum (strain SN15 / ATCC MYA-4574 / FGSC 10173) TaxID=321614 RepID=Q0V419_PHANO|nr:hypothetical protein SNOG_01245 [Parastagonospora nodorum SN15]EAT90894.2 hypothetical protein SNOG_01245 [Parastagonospora nodorum SN15]
MAPQRKRENRENQFYNVGVQGRKTGITLADRGVYDEHGLEPISGIFSSPEKSPPKRGDAVNASESMDIQERQRRGQRANVYDIPEDGSPVPQTSAVLEESFVQEEITANEDSVVFNEVAEESSIAQIGDDTINDAEAVEDLVEQEESELAPEPVKEPARRGRKRKSDVLEPVEEEGSALAKSRKRGATSAQASEMQKKEKGVAPAPAASSRRSKRVSDMTEQTDQDVSALDGAHDAPPPAKKRGRPPRAKSEAKGNTVASKPSKVAASKADAKDNLVTTKITKGAAAKAKPTEVFKKPPKPAPKPKEKPVTKGKERAHSNDRAPETTEAEAGKLVDVHGHPLNKKDIEQMSTMSTGSRYGRGRHLSVFRELEPEAVARVGRTGRHRVQPIDFWKNDRIAYDPTGSMTSIVKNQYVEPERKAYKASSTKGKKRNLTAIEEEEVELDPWEEEDGTLVGNYRDFDAATDATTNEVLEGQIAWAQKGMQPVDVPDGSFQYTKLASAGDFFNWGIIDLRVDQMKRTKNSRKMHMIFNVQSGTVEVKVHENEFTVHRGGVWQVPRGMLHFPSFLLPPHAVPAYSLYLGKRRNMDSSAAWSTGAPRTPGNNIATATSRFPDCLKYCATAVTLHLSRLGTLHVPTAYDVAQHDDYNVALLGQGKREARRTTCSRLLQQTGTQCRVTLHAVHLSSNRVTLQPPRLVFFITRSHSAMARDYASHWRSLRYQKTLKLTYHNRQHIPISRTSVAGRHVSSSPRHAKLLSRSRRSSFASFPFQSQLGLPE